MGGRDEIEGELNDMHAKFEERESRFPSQIRSLESCSEQLREASGKKTDLKGEI
jgi:hypothetical protein